MKNLIKKKKLSLSLLLIFAFLLESCSSFKKPRAEATSHLASTSTIRFVPDLSLILATPMAVPFKGYNKFSSQVGASSLPPRFENFDQKPYASEAFVIANMIAVVQPELDEEARDIIASNMSIAIKKYDIEPQVFVAIIDTESNFQSDKVSTTGDLSLAQINVEVWNKEFKRMNLPLINKDRIVVDQVYALTIMAEILNIIKLRHEKNDRRWYARYHSSSKKHKSDYLHKLEIRLAMLASSENLNNQIAQSKNLKILAPAKFATPHEKTIQANNLVAELLSPRPLPTPTPMYSPAALVETTEMATLLLKDVLPISIYR